MNPVTRSLRILLLTHYAIPHVGGIEVTAQALSQNLRARGREVVQISSAAGSGGLRDRGADGVIRIPAWNVLERKAGVPYPLFAPTLAREVRRAVRWADVVHAHGFLYLPTLAGLHYAGRLRDPRRPVSVLTEQVGHVAYTSAPIERVQQAAIATLGRYAVRAADAVTAVNERVRAEMVQLGARGPVRVITNGFDPAAFRPPETGETERIRRELGWDDRPRVLFVGRLVEKKGVGVAVGASEAAGGAFELVLAGPGGLPTMPSTVRALGAVSQADLALLYRASDAFLLPSWGEGMPLSVVEALASGLPVFLGRDPVYERLASEAGDAVTLIGPDSQQVAQTLRSFLSDPARRAVASLEGARYARSHFSWDRIVDEYESVYRSLLDGDDTG